MLREFSLRGMRSEHPRSGVALIGRIRIGDGFTLEDRVLLSSVVLTGRTWTLTSFDQAGTNWSGSTLVFTSQVADVAGGQEIEGFFDWASDGDPRGRELFRGTLDSSGHLAFEGYELQNPVAIILGRYQADLGADGNSLLDGSWSDGIPGAWSAKALPFQGLPDLSISTPADRVVPAKATDLNLHHIFGTEKVNIPVHVVNTGASSAQGAVTFVVYASLTTGINSQLKLGERTYGNIDLAAGAAKDLTVTVTIPSNLLAVGKSYYFIAEAKSSAFAESDLTDNTAATSRTFSYLGAPGSNPGVFSNANYYFQFIRDTLKGNLVAKTVNPAVNVNDAASFITTFEGEHLYPYRDASGAYAIGIGINLVTISSTPRADLAKSVQAYYKAKYHQTLGSASSVISMLKSQAKLLTSPTRAKDAITRADSQRLFKMVLPQYVKKAQAAIGSTVYAKLSAGERVVLVDLVSNNDSVSHLNHVASALKAGDFVRAGFNLVDAKRTTQAAIMTSRVEAEYQNLLAPHVDKLGKLVT